MSTKNIFAIKSAELKEVEKQLKDFIHLDNNNSIRIIVPYQHFAKGFIKNIGGSQDIEFVYDENIKRLDANIRTVLNAMPLIFDYNVESIVQKAARFHNLDYSENKFKHMLGVRELIKASLEMVTEVSAPLAKTYLSVQLIDHLYSRENVEPRSRICDLDYRLYVQPTSAGANFQITVTYRYGKTETIVFFRQSTELPFVSSTLHVLPYKDLKSQSFTGN